MDFEALAYPDTFEIGGVAYQGHRRKSEVTVPYTDAPSIEIGQVIRQGIGPNVIELRVTDVQFLHGGSQRVATHHPHLLTLEVDNVTSAPHRSQPKTTSIHIGSLSAHQVQVDGRHARGLCTHEPAHVHSSLP